MRKIIDITQRGQCRHHHLYLEEDADANEVHVCMYYGEKDPYICRFNEGKCPLPDADETDATKEEGNGKD